MSDEIRTEIAREREQLARGICPRSGKPWAAPGTYGTPRPACAICDCGESEDDDR